MCNIVNKMIGNISVRIKVPQLVFVEEKDVPRSNQAK